MRSDLFIRVLEHIAEYVKCTKEDPIILIMDNHQSHLAVDCLMFAKENGIHIITLPPHTSHKTQPLDRSVFGPMKKYYNSCVNAWMMKNPGLPVTIRQVGQFIGESWLKASTPTNIMAGFEASGIWPFNPDVFADDEFMSAAPTEQPPPAPSQPQPDRQQPLVVVQPQPDEQSPSCTEVDSNSDLEIPSTSRTTQFTPPHVVCAFPKVLDILMQ